MRNVGQRDDDGSGASNQRSKAFEDTLRVSEMLKDIRAQDNIERSDGQRACVVIQVDLVNLKIRTRIASDRRGSAINLDSNDCAPSHRKLRAQVTARAPDIKDSAAGWHQPKEKGVRSAVWVKGVAHPMRLRQITNRGRNGAALQEVHTLCSSRYCYTASSI